MPRVVVAILTLALAGCVGEIVSWGDDGTGGGPDAGAIGPGLPDAGGGNGGPDAGGPDDPGDGHIVDVTRFPFHDDRDTSMEPRGVFDFYACAQNTDESGPEILYHVILPSDGFLTAAVHEEPGVDVDVHILSEADPESCVARGNRQVKADVTKGEYWIVVDTHGGPASAGPFGLDIGFTVPSRGSCAMETGLMARVNDGGVSLPMPATGPIVVEAHLVTQEEPPPYPMTHTDELEEHYELSQARTGFVMFRSQDWAPLEGGSHYGAGIGSPTVFPVLHEGWYVNMYWRASSRPERGTRMILRDPAGGSRAVVVAAGYETGPGNLDHIAGTPEETHFYMGTTHLSPMTIGIAVDQDLAYGPRVCE